MSDFQNSNTIVLCGSCPCGDKNCPTITLQEDGFFLIRDDYNQQIKVTAEDLRQLFLRRDEVEALMSAASSKK